MNSFFSSSRSSSLSLIAVALLLGQSGSLFAQSDSQSRNSPAVLSAFRNVVSRPGESTVRILCDGKEAAVGTIVGADGWILTKYSLLKGKIVCKLKNGKSYSARIQGAEEQHDLAMLKVSASDLKPIEWRSGQTAEIGDWLASAGPSDTPLAIGVVSVASRKPAREPMIRRGPSPNSGYLGIELEPGDNGEARIGKVQPSSAAEKAGLKAGDIVLKVEGRKVPTPDSLVATIQGFKPEQVVSLRVKRGDEEVDLKATLAKRPPGMNGNRGDTMNSMGSPLSDRRSGFPEILQHDTVIKPTDCGSPIVDLDGKAVGINIARAGRTESYAIPYQVIQGLMGDLKSGKLAAKDETSEIEGSIKRMKMELLKLEGEIKTASATARKALEKRHEEVRKKIRDAENTLEKMNKDDK